MRYRCQSQAEQPTTNHRTRRGSPPQGYTVLNRPEPNPTTQPTAVTIPTDTLVLPLAPPEVFTLPSSPLLVVGLDTCAIGTPPAPVATEAPVGSVDGAGSVVAGTRDKSGLIRDRHRKKKAKKKKGRVQTVGIGVKQKKREEEERKKTQDTHQGNSHRHSTPPPRPP
jgi:hypothetical protein